MAVQKLLFLLYLYIGIMSEIYSQSKVQYRECEVDIKIHLTKTRFFFVLIAAI